MEPLGFRFQGREAVTVGVVTAIDADGREVRGELGWDGTWLELVVPGAFLEGASWPLVVDPLITGPNFQVQGSEAFDPDVAYDASTDRYLVVWTQRASLFDLDVRARRIADSGLGDPYTLPIETSSDSSSQPAVGNLDSQNEFFVAYTRREGFFGDADVEGLFVDAKVPLFGFSKTILLDDSPSWAADQVDVGSSQAGLFTMQVVWRRVGSGLRKARVLSDGLNPVGIVSYGTLTSNAADANPRLSSSIAYDGAHVVAWRRFFNSPAPGDHDVYLRAIQPNGALVGSEVGLTTIGVDEQPPRIDGDGEQFMLLYDRENAVHDGSAFREVVLDGTKLSVGAELFEWVAGPFGQADVAFSGYDFVVCITDGLELNDLHFRSIAPFTFKVGELNGIPGNFDVSAVPVLATTWQGTGEPGHDGLMVWPDTDPVTGGTNIAGKHITPGFGIEEKGGGCGEVGETRTGLPVLGKELTFAMEDAPAFSPSILMIAAAEGNLPCGPCVIVPSAADPIFFTFTATIDGDAEQVLTIPDNASLDGAKVWAQWLILDLFDPECDLFPVDVADAHELTLHPPF